MEAPWLTPPKIFMRVNSAGKVIATIFWDSQGVIMIDYLEQSRWINGAYYAGKLRWLRCRKKHKKEARKTDSQCSALAGQCP